LAKKLGYQFIDLDKKIEIEAGKSISEIFEFEGEIRFRAIEAETFATLAYDKHNVIALGGGTILEEINAKTAKNTGTVVYLKLPYEKLYNRIKNDTRRPLVVFNTKEQLEEIYNKRTPIYSTLADLVIDADNSIYDIVNKILMLL